MGSNTGGGVANLYLSTPPVTGAPQSHFDLIFFIQVFKTRRQRVKTLDSVSRGTICTVGGAMEARFNKKHRVFKYDNNFKQPNY